MTTTVLATPLADRAGRLAALADRRWALVRDDDDPGARDRARQLREHVRAYVLPRIGALDAPLLVVLLGSTGAGKSTLMNSLAGAPVSRTGVLRPTTRDAVLLATDHDADTLARGALATIPADRLVRAPPASARPGVALVDAPDLDSIEHANRELADALVEAADLCVFVTTAMRYADQVPFHVLERIAERGLPIVVVVNRLPPGLDDRGAVLGDVRRVFAAAPLRGLDDERIEVVGVGEGDLESSTDALAPAAAAPVVARVDELAADRERRLALARRALEGALAGLVPLTERVIADLAVAANEAAALRAVTQKAYDAELRALLDELRGGTFLRTEVLRHWQSYVKADQITRFFSKGLGRLRGSIVAVIRGMPEAPVGVVEREVTSDVIAVSVSRAAEAARRAASEWSGRPGPAERLARDPTLWSASPDFAARLQPRLRDWVVSIATEVQERGATKRNLAFGVSLGVNALAIAAMIGVFAHTAGVTGTEIGIVAATGFLNQKLLQAIFGEAAMNEMVAGARSRLEALLSEEFTREQERFQRLTAEPTELHALTDELRTVVGQTAT